MRTGQTHLFIPGPTNVPEAVRRAMNVPQQDMRAADFGALTLPLFAGLKRVLRTESGTVFLFPGSGTGAWEAAITNTLSPGDRVLMSRFGQFSHLWAEMAERLGLEVDLIDVDWGEGVPVETYAERLAADTGHTIKGVFVTHNETATGVTSDVAAVRAALDAAGHPALLFVDGVSSIASIDFRMDEWGCGSGRDRQPEGADAACRAWRSGGQRQGAGGVRDGDHAAGLFHLCRHGGDECRGLFPLHPADAAVSRPRRRACPDRGRGARRGDRAPSSPGRGACAARWRPGGSIWWPPGRRSIPTRFPRSGCPTASMPAR
jgi:hypothetical protein